MAKSTSVSFFALLILVLGIAGCNEQQSLEVEITSDAGATEVYANDKHVGSTPIKLDFKEVKKLHVGSSNQKSKNKADVDKKEIFAELTAGYLPLTANLPLFVALDNKLFEKHGIKVKAIETTTPNDIVTGIVSGDIDFAAVLAYTLLFPASQKFPDSFKLFGSSEETETRFTSSIITLADSGINTVDDLKGKRIGVYTGLVQINFLKAILAGIGIEESEVEIIEISPRLQIQGLVSGQYDALSSTEPTVNIAVQQGIAKVVVESPRVKYIMSPFPSTASTISAKLLEKNPKAAKAVIYALEDAVALIKADPNSAAKSLLNYTPIPKKDSDAVIASLKLFRYNNLGEENRLNVQRFADYMYEIGLLKQPIEDVNDLFGDQEFIGR